MDIRDDSGVVIDDSIDIDFDNPEKTFIFPRITRLRRLLRLGRFDKVKIFLKYVPGIYLLSEITFDNRDLNVFDSRFVDSLVVINKNQNVDWTVPSVLTDRRLLRPLPDYMLDYLIRNSFIDNIDFKTLAESFLKFVSERSSLKILSNESCGLHSSFGESMEEFQKVCIDYASLEKSKKALDLAKIISQEILQNVASLDHAKSFQGTKKEDLASSLIEDYSLACKSLLNKAVSLHVLELQNDKDDRSRTTNYSETLVKDGERLRSSLEYYREEFEQFSSEVIERFSEIEQIINEKAMNISTIELPLYSCTLRLLRVAQVWLPYWSLRLDISGEVTDSKIKAY